MYMLEHINDSINTNNAQIISQAYFLFLKVSRIPAVLLISSLSAGLTPGEAYEIINIHIVCFTLLQPWYFWK